MFKKDGKVYEEKVGRQFVDNMTPARAARIRAERIEGKRQSRKEIREEQKAAKTIWTVERLRQEYAASNPPSDTDRGRYLNYIHPSLGSKRPRDIAPLDVERLRLKLGKTLKPQTVKHVLMLLKRIVNYGVKHGLTPGLSFKPPCPGWTTSRPKI